MKIKDILILGTALVSATLTIDSNACTNIIVTKGASIDGTSLVTYAADSHQLFGELYYHPACDWPQGSMLDVYSWDEGFYIGQIPQAAHTFQTVGNMNEHQLTIAETTFGGREELPNKTGIDYGSLIYITLQRASTAREAISQIAKIMDTYGYLSEGETFSIADKDECWIMEIVGKGEEKGGVWVAIRIPDGYISAHANQSRIDHFPLNDKENCLYAPDVITFARKMGYFNGKDEDFSFCDAYCPADFATLRGCEARVWSAFNMLAGSNFNSEKYLDFAMGYNPKNKMPLYVKPEKKLSVKDLADAMRDHYEGTPMDMTQDVGAGPNHLPYRWRPMDWNVDGKDYIHERAIATQQTGFWFVAQSRNNVPDEVGGILWFGVDDAATSAVTPIYTSIKEVPHCFEHGNGSMIRYSPTSAFWIFNRITHFAYLFYDRVAPEIRSVIDKYENENINLASELDRKAVKMVESGNTQQAASMLTEFCKNRAQHLCDTWNELEGYLMVKYMDGNVKWQNEDGTFKTNGSEGFEIPESPIHPEFPERWLRNIVNDHGKTIEAR